MTLCGHTERLLWKESNEGMFEDIEWWEPELQGTPLEEEDNQYIDQYTGSFAFSGNVGRLLRGIAPFFKLEDRWSGKWAEAHGRDRAVLAKEVLDFSVDLATALNKLPSPSHPIELFRGAWVPYATAMHLLSKPKRWKLPWFQPATTLYHHSMMFMHPRFAPDWAKNLETVDLDCSGEDVLCPVRFTFETARAKNVSKWNPDEREQILLPNLPFEVVSAEKVMNDPIINMTSEDLSEWLNTAHALPDWVASSKRKSWTALAFVSKGKHKVGPWPQAALAVREKGMTGKEFVRVFRKKKARGVCELLGIVFEEQAGFYAALQARYKLSWVDPMRPHAFPFYLAVTLRDAEL